MNGIYQGPGWNEYLPKQWLELPRAYLNTQLPHPRLLPVENIQKIKIRLTKEPYSDWYRQLRRQYEANKKIVFHKTAVMTKRSLFVKQAAFLFHMTGDNVYLNEAMQVLTDLPAPSSRVNLEGGTPGVGWGDYLESAEALMDLLVGYDLLFSEIPFYLRNSIEETILKVNEQLIGAMNITTRNNHTVLFGCAFTLTAMTIDHPQQVLDMNANQLYQYGLDVLAESLGNIAPDGGYSEGPGYATYILSYLTRLAVYQQYLIGYSLLDNPVLSNMITWTMDNRKSNGYSNRFDDSNASLYSFILLAQPLMKNDFNFSLTNISADEINGIDGSNLVELLIWYESRPPIRYQYEYAANYYPFYGQLIVKDNWEKPNLSAYFLAEHPEWFADAHEHIDPLSVEISYQAQDILVDAGYGPNTAAKNRPFYKSDRSYNSILIDGRGYDANPYSDGLPKPHWDLEYVGKGHAGARVSIPFKNGSITRSFHFLSPDVIIIRDQSVFPNKHTITSHFNSKGSVHIIDDHQIMIESGDVQTRWISLDELYSQQFLLTGFYGDDDNNIRFMDFSKSEQKHHQQQFIVIPGFDESRFEINDLAVNQNESSVFLITDHSRQKRIIVGRGKGHLWEYGEIATDAQFFIMEEDMNGHVFFVLEDGYTFRYKNMNVTGDVSFSLVLKETSTGWEGVISTGEKGKVNFNGFMYPLLILNDQFVRKNNDGSLVCSVSGVNNYLSMGLPQDFLDLKRDIARRKAEYAAYNSLIAAQNRLISPNHYLDTKMKSYTMDNLHWAASHAIGYNSYRFAGDSAFASGLANSLMGLARYNYNPDPSKQNFRLPHYYKVTGGWNEVGLSISEDGDFTADGILVRNLRFEAEKGERKLRLHVNRPLPSTKSLQLETVFSKNIAMNYGSSSFKNQQNQYVSGYYHENRWSISPMISWNQTEITQLALTGRWRAAWWTISRWQAGETTHDYFKGRIRMGRNATIGSELRKNTDMTYYRYWLQYGGNNYFLYLNYLNHKMGRNHVDVWDVLLTKFRPNFDWSVQLSTRNDSLNMNTRVYHRYDGSEIRLDQALGYHQTLKTASQAISVSNRINNNYYLYYEISGLYHHSTHFRWQTGLFPLVYLDEWIYGPGVILTNDSESILPYTGIRMVRQGDRTMDVTFGRNRTGNSDSYLLYFNVTSHEKFPYLYVNGFMKWNGEVGITQSRFNVYPTANRLKPTFMLFYQRNRQLIVSGGVVWII